MIVADALEVPPLERVDEEVIVADALEVPPLAVTDEEDCAVCLFLGGRLLGKI